MFYRFNVSVVLIALVLLLCTVIAKADDKQEARKHLHQGTEFFEKPAMKKL